MTQAQDFFGGREGAKLIFGGREDSMVWQKQQQQQHQTPSSLVAAPLCHIIVAPSFFHRHRHLHRQSHGHGRHW